MVRQMKSKSSKRRVLNKKIRKGDKVIVIAGNDRGQIGEVLNNLGTKIVIQGVNVCKKATRKSQDNPTGGFIELERPIHISNVKLCVGEDKGVKLKISTDKEGARQLVYQEDKKDVVYRSVKKA